MAGKTTPTATTNALVAPSVSDDDLTAILQGAGAIAPPGQKGHYMTVEGSVFVAGDEMYPYNPKTDEPAFVGRITEPIIQYQGAYFTPAMAQIANRPDIAERYCKSYFDTPGQAREYAEDGTSCHTCPFGPFLKSTPTGDKCKWRGRLNLQIIPPTGRLEGDETIWSLDLSTTSVIEFVGTKREPQRGSITDYTFMHKLAKLGAAENEEDPRAGVLRALTAYQNGAVIAEFRLLRNQNNDGSIKWYTISANPILILDFEETPVIEAGEDQPIADAVTGELLDADGLPF